MLNAKRAMKLQALVQDEYPGSATAMDVNAFADKHGFDEIDVAEMLDDLEIYQCAGCGWWQHEGEIFLGHVEDCEGHDELICGDCCDV